MSCRFVHNTNLSLTSMLLESLGDRVISFSSLQRLFSPLSLSGKVYKFTSQQWCRDIPTTKSGPCVKPCKWNELAKRPCYGWVTGCGAEGPKHTSSPQITCELFPLDDRPLHYWLPVCTGFWEIHPKAILFCWVRQEAVFLAHRVIHSVTCTPRGAALVSPLLPFKACVCVWAIYKYAHAKTGVRTRAHVTIWTQDRSSGSSGSLQSCLWPVITGMCWAQVQTWNVNRY